MGNYYVTLRVYFMQAKEPFVSYVAEPPVLTISVSQNGVTDIQDDITANFNEMRTEAAKRGFLSDGEIEAEICTLILHAADGE